MRHASLALLLLTGCLVLGCAETADIDEDSTAPTWTDLPVVSPADFDVGFRRLTYEQFTHTLADLHGTVWKAAWAKKEHPASWYLDADELYLTFTEYGEGVWNYYRNQYPEDTPTPAPGESRGGYRRLDSTVHQEHVNVWLYAAMTLAHSKYENGVGELLMLQPCKEEALDDGAQTFDTIDEAFEYCASKFIIDFGMRAFRRPLTEEEHDHFLGIYQEVGEKYAAANLPVKKHRARGLRNVITVITQSPEFLYRVELGDENGNLTAWELASRLSYHFWDTMPDDALFAAAADGSLMTEEGYKTQVERLASDPKSKRTSDSFYRDYFRVQNIGEIAASDSYNKFNSFPSEVYGSALPHIRQALEDELANLGTWFTSSHPGTYEDMFRSNLHFLECQQPKGLSDQCYGAGPYSHWSYGIEGTCVSGDCTGLGWDGVSDPITLPEPERVGLLSRLGVLAHDTYAARPIRRGLYIRETLLCERIPPPENCDVVKPPEVDGDNLVLMSVREKVEEITEQPGTSCAGCHATFINGFGHALGHFSSKGQYWEKEHAFTTDKISNGEFTLELASEDEWKDIDTSGVTYFNSQTVSFDGANELTDVLVNSGRLEWCWAREYFRYAVGRIERTEDAGTIEDLAQMLRNGATLAEGFKAIAHSPQFKTLVKTPPEEEQP